MGFATSLLLVLLPLHAAATTSTTSSTTSSPTPCSRIYLRGLSSTTFPYAAEFQGTYFIHKKRAGHIMPVYQHEMKKLYMMYLAPEGAMVIFGNSSTGDAMELRALVHEGR